jgi:hypothetical protein
MSVATVEFVEFPKMARLSRECIVTEKIDGTNACIKITEDGGFLTGSRTRWITPSDDNYGFSRWAHGNKNQLMKLGPGTHFGEWWGSGCQRGYGLSNGEKRWSLFNVARWCLAGEEPQRIPTADPRIEKYQQVLPECCHLVPVLYRGIFDTFHVENALSVLKVFGSKASPGFMRPEGVVCYHVAGNIGFKKTIEKDDEYKSKK